MLQIVLVGGWVPSVECRLRRVHPSHVRMLRTRVAILCLLVCLWIPHGGASRTFPPVSRLDRRLLLVPVACSPACGCNTLDAGFSESCFQRPEPVLSILSVGWMSNDLILR